MTQKKVSDERTLEKKIAAAKFTILEAEMDVVRNQLSNLKGKAENNEELTHQLQ